MGAMLFRGPLMAHAPRKAMDGVRGAEQSPARRATRLSDTAASRKSIVPRGRSYRPFRADRACKSNMTATIDGACGPSLRAKGIIPR